ncbi:HAMP domain-containing histidine kinase [bacterium]|nr:HAMP domain-containing histidine kinase [bacterium]
MNKFILKFFVFYVFLIFVLFFSLITFQKKTEEKMYPMPTFQTEMPHENMPMPPHSREHNPPVAIPLLAITFIAVVPIYVFLKYISVNFITPLDVIKSNIQKIKSRNLDVVFKTDSDDKSTQETFCELNLMVEGLKQKEKLQGNLIQNIAHDLRAPIFAQERALDILKEEFENHEILSALSENNDLYLKMINLIIDSFGEKEITIEKINFELSNEIDKIIKTFMPSALKKQIKLVNNVSQNFSVFADYVAMNRILANLISNAIENIDNNKEVKIYGKYENENAIIIVEDNGKGINKENISTLFDKYTSFDKTERKKTSGLGLFIVKDLVSKNGGNIEVESEENLYTRFKITLPKEKQYEQI